MDWVLLSTAQVATIHDAALNPGELAGMAGDKSLDGTLARVENRVAYGMVEDAFDLAAAYAVAIAQGHCFNDANKRTAFHAMDAALAFNGHVLEWTMAETGDIIIRVAQRLMDEGELALWLRHRAGR
ncbi:MAG: type II toxin-antitoxin system death-on-curing family toxin [Gemmobacter sp.]